MSISGRNYNNGDRTVAIDDVWSDSPHSATLCGLASLLTNIFNIVKCQLSGVYSYYIVILEC